ncbi:menaquinone-dependent protoporphyrinogen IX dehydrogenase [Formosa algae]|uniref:Protoporphyrinogen IX dehydrogenase [quinone] n=1 Tax=Formosa algae TaxID=225843 RepID=A0A9X1C9Q5_9FLAO|nr:menaquinone-dependent protoporphyrinogen IX dehydrogenase [Formosa algae]MBP1840723.1 menaquinone-dependent protoporphyrinogen oxidase [Formosa algae]MDQ0335864.1 menaquinone-dependent protoporphyrinogen oxidase [Formosa algae]OEI81234.1 protoporphyrinogen oxidase [Formosa algae]
MNKRIAILYATTDGQTLKICRRIAEYLQDFSYSTDLCEISDFPYPLSQYSKVVIGASIRYGTHSKKVAAFIQNYKPELELIDTSFFSVNLVARKPDKNRYYNNPYVIKFFKELKWTPTRKDVFAGTLDYKSYNILDRIMIKIIMKMTGGPTSSKTPIEYTDWDRVKAFALQICQN